MESLTVPVFFYGSFLNPEVLAEVDLRPTRRDVARLWGYDIRIEPLANLVREDGRCVYGVLSDASHAELERLYGQDWLGTYHPYPVTVETLSGGWEAALCYIAPLRAPAPAAADYVDRTLLPARELGFPDWYLRRLEGFRPAGG